MPAREVLVGVSREVLLRGVAGRVGVWRGVMAWESVRGRGSDFVIDPESET
jgi:hypothetical protein